MTAAAPLVRYVSPFGSPAWMPPTQAAALLADDDARWLQLGRWARPSPAPRPAATVPPHLVRFASGHRQPVTAPRPPPRPWGGGAPCPPPAAARANLTGYRAAGDRRRPSRQEDTMPDDLPPILAEHAAAELAAAAALLGEGVNAADLLDADRYEPVLAEIERERRAILDDLDRERLALLAELEGGGR